MIRARTGEGRARAKARGVKLGRKPKLTVHQKREALERRERGDETHAEIGRSYNVSAAGDFEVEGMTRPNFCPIPARGGPTGVFLPARQAMCRAAAGLRLGGQRL
jgi:hypothetical protein